MRNPFFLLCGILIITVVGIDGCKKPQPPDIPSTPKTTLFYEVYHHEWTVGNIAVYIKGQTDTMSLPYLLSADLATFDSSTQASPIGDGKIGPLPAGNYYLYANGFDKIWGDTVGGGKQITILPPKADTLRYIRINTSE
ncbi:MAG: hypothetical protein IPI59_03090 [Sphingobacteriales bacterium]|nr:hypothetical protein [Sphingobacteriales bacterium]MBP9140529.1 hypothetical protein [Chitinophagales bacterium]MDA0197290.1 hypothetical protein [Bacteroidota bacterium]MBK6890401.1 hypothetical protein [Sphingobacteriales bacterium]MBK7526544.1 hypothetical protein [Sphingobacteriales bacterium]